jgi:hypothetical protein
LRRRHLEHVQLHNQRRLTAPGQSEGERPDPNGEASRQATWRKTVSLYRAIYKAGEQITHGERGKRKRLAEAYRAKIAEVAPNVDPVVFVNRSFAYCYKHPGNSSRRRGATDRATRNA